MRQFARGHQGLAVRIRVLILATIVGLACVAVPAFGAYGPFELPSAHGPHATRSERITFPLPTVWQRAAGSQEGTPEIGGYARGVDLGDGATCTLQIETAADPVAVAPRLRAGVLHGLSGFDFRTLAVRAHGHRGSSRWFLGADTGIAVLRTPRGFAPRRLGWTVVWMQIMRDLERFGPPDSNGYPPLNPTPAQVRSCARLQTAARVNVLLSALRNVRIEPGDPYAKSING